MTVIFGDDYSIAPLRTRGIFIGGLQEHSPCLACLFSGRKHQSLATLTAYFGFDETVDKCLEARSVVCLIFLDTLDSLFRYLYQ